MKALLLIDIQKGITRRGLYNKEPFTRTVNRAIEKYREKNCLIIFVQHENKHLSVGSDDWKIDESILVNKDNKIFSKQKGDAFSNIELVECLKQNEIKEILVGGLVSHGCIKHTCMGGVNNGYDISLIKGGHSCCNNDAEEKIKETEHFLQNLGVNIISIENIYI